MFNQLSMSKSKDLICHSIHLIDSNEMVNIRDLFFTKDEASDIVGISPETLNTIQEVAQAIGNDSIFSIK